MEWLIFFLLMVSWIAFVSYKKAREIVHAGAPAPVKAAMAAVLISFFFLIVVMVGDISLSRELSEDRISFAFVAAVIAVVIWGGALFSCIGYFFLGIFISSFDRHHKKSYLLIVFPAIYLIFLASMMLFQPLGGLR
ncbi:MAG: hypothetical protein LBP90_03455 [Burkholderiales bacterium]|nr:hypothetical protein [Burkholderiales bacterium]